MEATDLGHRSFWSAIDPVCFAAGMVLLFYWLNTPGLIAYHAITHAVISDYAGSRLCWPRGWWIKNEQVSLKKISDSLCPQRHEATHLRTCGPTDSLLRLSFRPHTHEFLVPMTIAVGLGYISDRASSGLRSCAFFIFILKKQNFKNICQK